MGHIAIITDTDSSIPVSISKSLGIIQVPIMVNFGDKSLAAVDEIDDSEVFSRIDANGKLPTTAAPSPGQFSEAFTQAFEGGLRQYYASVSAVK